MSIAVWFESLTMEEAFIVTGAAILAVGIGLGLLVAWIFEKEDTHGKD